MAEDWEIPINLVPAEAPPVVSQTWTLPEGDITILVAEDGSSLSAYFDSLEWHGWPFDITFIGESEINYPCSNMSGTFHLDGTELFEAIKPEHMDEPVAAVRIDGVSVARNTLGDPDHHWYEDLNGSIERAQEAQSAPGGSSLRGRFRFAGDVLAGLPGVGRGIPDAPGISGALRGGASRRPRPTALFCRSSAGR